ncbi:MAG: hypothetical protein ACT4PZ_19775 [Panacagrimonas sp.]
MNRIGNPLFMIIPEEAVGLLVAAMIAVGGLMIVVGARTAGKAVVLGGIAIPFVSVVVSALMNDFFTALPEDLIMPVAWLIMGVTYFVIGAMLLRFVFGDQAVEDAKGILLADVIRALFRFLIWWPVLLIWGGATAYMVWLR